jgi:hypothetical protein
MRHPLSQGTLGTDLARRCRRPGVTLNLATLPLMVPALCRSAADGHFESFDHQKCAPVSCRSRRAVD